MISTEEEARAFVARRCDERAVALLSRFADMLAVENAAQNLVAATSLGTIWQRHIADSAQLLDQLRDRAKVHWLDIGSGAGFPGLVLALMRPGWSFDLAEPRKRRAEWLRRCLADLEIANCTVQDRRIEQVDVFIADVISARAVASLPTLITMARRFSTSDTVWLLPKGRSAAQEIAALPGKTRELFHVEQSATDADAGIVVGSGLEATKP